MLKIGPYTLESNVLLAPMAGITDLPFRHIVQSFGVGMTVAEMVSSKPNLQSTSKSRLRQINVNEPLPRAVQIVGNEPRDMANAAARHVDLGAGLIDINMGCPAKKVCRRAAGSALLADEKRVQEILQAVVAAVDVPVTLKIRTGISKILNNAVSIAHIAEQSGIQSLVVHGRSRECLFKGQAEYSSVAKVKQTVNIPVIANGDINTPEDAFRVLKETYADGVMIGRAAQGAPWLPAVIASHLSEENETNISSIALAPSLTIQHETCLKHIALLYEYYGEKMGLRIARKHIRWYLMAHPGGLAVSKNINRIEQPSAVLAMINAFYEILCCQNETDSGVVNIAA